MPTSSSTQARSVRAVYELRHGETKTHLVFADNPIRNPYTTKNTFKDVNGNSMIKSEKKVAPIWLDMDLENSRNNGAQFTGGSPYCLFGVKK